MCGIAGFVSLAGPRDAADLREIGRAMARRMVHRGPDDHGVWVSPDRRCVLAHQRLSIIDTSAAGHQPMLSHDGKRSIVYNGEFYNFLEVRAELEAKGHEFRTQCDTEVLIAALAEWGEALFPKIDAMYAIGHWDTEAKRLLLARDPFGKKPLYFAHGDGWFAFASELHALALLPGFDDTIDRDTIAGFLSLQYVDAPRTIYRQAEKLPPGHFLELDLDGRQRIARHFEFQPGKGSEGEKDDPGLVDELEEILVRCTKRRMIADVPLGAFLSGGVDSATVVAIMTKVLGSDAQTFSIGFTDTNDSEHLMAREMAQHLGANHRDKVLAPDVLALAEKIATVLDEPNGDSSCLPTYLLSEFARQWVTVSLSGDGGDEMFGGYGRYFATVDEAAAARKNGQSYETGRTYYGCRILPFDDPDIESLFGEVPDELARDLRELRGYVDGGTDDLLHRLRKTDAEHYMPGAVLAKVDRMSMQHSLEVRSPLLSIDIARFAERLHPNTLYANEHGKLLLKRVAERHIPRAWLDRRKMGFGLPMQIWGKEQILGAARERLLDKSCMLSGWIEPSRLDAFLKKQRLAFSLYQVWGLLVLEIWLQTHRARNEKTVEIPRRTEPVRHPREALDPLTDSRDFTLLRSLEDTTQAVTVFCTELVPRWWHLLPEATLVSKEGFGNACGPRFVRCDWTAGKAELAKVVGALRPGIAVFAVDELCIPEGVSALLAEHGFTEQLARCPSGWKRKNLGAPRRNAPEIVTTTRDRAMRIKLRARPWTRLRQDEGHCFRFLDPRLWMHYRRKREPLWADVQLYEDGRLLPHPRSATGEIKNRGEGRYALFGAEIWFSSSDNSSPTTNGRAYEAVLTWKQKVHSKPVAVVPQKSPSPASWIAESPSDEAYWQTFRHAVEADRPPVMTSPKRIGLVIGQLGPGGAERQLCYLARALKQQGYDVSVYTVSTLDGDASHYVPMLESHDIPILDCTVSAPGYDFSADLRCPERHAALVGSMPPIFREEAWRLYTNLRVHEPDVLHCFLDSPNLLGAIAGFLAGVPRVVLSGRNVNPSHFPYLDVPWYRDWYAVFRDSRRVRFSANSRLGCRDYEEWLDFDEGTFRYVPNGLDVEAIREPDAAALAQLRSSFGIAPGQPTLLGVFRLSPEKRPMMFVDASVRLREQFPNLRVLLAGIGAMQQELERAIAKRGIGDWFTLLGRREDIPALMHTADLLLMTSENEGMPNAVLEAMYARRPVVCPRVGACPDVIEHERSGLLYDLDDSEAMVAGCASLLGDAGLRARIGEAARKRVLDRFSLDAMVAGSKALYS